MGLSREERQVLVIGEIIQELLKADEAKKDVNLNRMKSLISSKYGLDSSPRLVDIIAAVPQDAKKILLPKLRAKPIRTASGVSFFYQPSTVWQENLNIFHVFYLLDCSCCCHVQAASLSTHQFYRKHMRLLPWRT